MGYFLKIAKLLSNLSLESTQRQLIPSIRKEALVMSLGRLIRNQRKFPKYQQGLSFHTIHTLRKPNDDGKNDNLPRKNPVVLPYLMSYPSVMWPSIMQTFRNWFFYHFVIRNMFDKDFDMDEFDRGARQAISVVSKKLANGQFEDLEELVEPNALRQVKQRIVDNFSLFQRQLLEVEVEDIFFSFPYEVGIIMPPPPPPLHRQASHSEARNELAAGPEKRLVEITIVVHVLRGFHRRVGAGDVKPLHYPTPYVHAEAKDTVMVCNYRFLKDFTEGATNQNWVINLMNHFLPVEYQSHGVPN